MTKFIYLVFVLFSINVCANQNELYLKFKNELSSENILKNNLMETKKVENNVYYLISFSMRDEAIKEVMNLSSYYNIPVYINGLINDSMKDTTDKFLYLFGQNSNYGIGIDPNVFDKYNVTSVPVLIVECDGSFDKVSGNIPMKQALEKIFVSGDCSSSAEKILRGDK